MLSPDPWFSFAVSAALKSTLVLGVAALATWLLRGRSAAARHTVWTVAAIAVLALPLLMATMPRLPIGGAAMVLDSGALLAASEATAASPATSMPDRPAGIPHAVQAPVPVSKSTGPAWPFWFLLVWAAGAVFALDQMCIGAIAMYFARRRSMPFADRDLLACLSHALDLNRDVDVLEDPRTSMPVAYGIFRPAVFLPEGAADWPEERRRLVLLHELAHIRRGDTITHFVSRFALCLHWWNPAAWMAWRGFLKERERAADDLVLEAGARASEYANELLEVARSMQPRHASGYAAIAMARRSQLEGRLLAILDPATRRRAPRRLTALAAAILAVVLTAPLASIHAQDQSEVIPADLDATIRAANAQKNHEILDQAAKAALAQGKVEIARKLLTASVAISAEVSGEQSVDYGISLIKLGDLAQRQHQDDEALTDYKGAIAAIGNRPEAAPAMLAAGILTLNRKDSEGAFSYFQQAENADPKHAQMAVTWMGIVRSRDPQRMSEAESLYQRAIQMGSPDSLDTAAAMDLYGYLLTQNGRTDEADQMHARSAAIRRARRSQSDVTSKITPPGTYRPGGDVTAPVPVYKPEPVYSEMARAAKLQGEVVLSLVIGVDGTASNIQVIHALGLGLDEQAIDTVSQWRFKPGTKDGVPVPVQAAISVNFRLL